MTNRGALRGTTIPATAPLVIPGVLPELARMVTYGHSLLSATGTTDVDRDAPTHLASMLKVRELPRALAGAVLGADASVLGGYAHVFQTDVRPSRGSTTLTASMTAASSTSVTVGSTANMAVGSMLHVGTGASGTGGGEILWVTAVTDATHAAIVRADGSATCVRNHASGDPVYVVPSDYICQNSLYLLWWGGNDLARGPITSATTRLRERFMAPFRSVISRHRCAEVYENDHSSCVYSGSWTPQVFTHVNSGAGTNQANTAGSSILTIHTPDNFPGGSDGRSGVIALCFETGSTGTALTTWTFTVDGVAAGTLDMPSTISAQYNCAVKRLTGLTAGRHTIVATLTTLGAGDGAYFDWWGIEAALAPLVLCIEQIRPFGYAAWAGLANVQRDTTLTLQANPPLNSFTVGNTTGWMVGATVTFEPGSANEETLEIATVPTGLTFTTTTNTAKTHAAATTVRSGVQDADVPKLNANIQSVIAEFDDQVAYIQADDIIGKQSKFFWYDQLHLSDYFHSRLTIRLYEAVRDRLSALEASYISSPTAPNPSALNFATFGGSVPGTVGTGAWLNQPAALTELFGFSAHRKIADLRRCFEARFVVGVAVAGASGASLRIFYSLNGGTSWKSLFRTSLYAEDTSHEAILTATGTKDSGWRPIAAEALVDNVLLSVWGINGNAVADPTFGTIDLYFR